MPVFQQGHKPAIYRVQCPLCGKEIATTGANFHFKAAHPGRSQQEFPETFKGKGKERNEEARPAPAAPPAEPLGRTAQNGHASPVALQESVLLTIRPQRFDATSTLVWMAKEITEKEWGWEHTEDIGTWLDTYIWYTMKRFGVSLLGYVVERPPRPQPKPQVKTAVGAR